VRSAIRGDDEGHISLTDVELVLQILLDKFRLWGVRLASVPTKHLSNVEPGWSEVGESLIPNSKLDAETICLLATILCFSGMSSKMWRQQNEIC
jgi:hypothetical protein